MRAELVGAEGPIALASLTPRDAAGIRAIADGDVRVANPSVLAYDIAGKGVTRFRGTIGLENPKADIGSTLNPQVRFFVLDAAPDMERLIPPLAGVPLPPAPPLSTITEAIDRVFWHLLGRAPSANERRAAERALGPSAGGRPSAPGLADLIWAITMKPEFQFVH
jgi:hypothetical protein